MHKKQIKDRKTPLWNVLFYIFLGIFSLSFVANLANEQQLHWQSKGRDPASYRFVAEKFWGMEQDLGTYNKTYETEEMNFLIFSTIPFRRIGVGSFYLATKKLHEWFSGKEGLSPKEVKGVTKAGIQLLLLFSYLLCALVLYKRCGSRIAFCSILIFLSLGNTWNIGSKLYSEPFIRIFFLLAFSCLVQAYYVKTGKQYWLIAVLTLLLLATHFKFQWIATAALFAMGMTAHFLVKKQLSYILVIALLFGLVHTSHIAISKKGWNIAKPTVGIGLHIAKKTKGVSVTYACKRLRNDRKRFGFCNPTKADITFKNWNKISQNYEKFSSQQQILDKLSLEYMILHPKFLLREMAEGLTYITNFPIKDPFTAKEHRILEHNILHRLIDISIWIALMGGIFMKKTFLMSIFGLSIWTIPGASHGIAHFGRLSARYFTPGQGLVLIIALLISLEVWRHYKINEQLHSFNKQKIH